MLLPISDILVNLIAVFIVFVARLLGFDAYSRAIRGVRRIPLSVRRLGGRSTVLLYTDCDDELHASRNLADNLERYAAELGRPVRFRVVRDGIDLARSPFASRSVLAVVILLTDVTQLSARPRDRVRVQNSLIRYVHRGGCLVLGHDVIYRRTRNERLQRLAGCALDTFHRLDEATGYVKVVSGPRATEEREILDTLPDRFELDDNEVVVGKWGKDVEYLYTWAENPEVPLVTRRSVGRGRVYWVNSGDSNADGPPRSIGRPEFGLVKLLGTIITKG